MRVNPVLAPPPPRTRVAAAAASSPPPLDVLTLGSPIPAVAPTPSLPRAALRDEAVALTQSLVRIDSSPNNLVAGENAVVDRLEDYARAAGLAVDRFESVNGKPVLVVTLEGTDPSLGSVGFVHHSDVVGTEGEWHLGRPFSGDITADEHGREVLVGRGSVDTKGPAAQVLVAMKQLKQSNRPLERTMKLYVFPDEETGGRDGAWHVSRNMPDKLADVQYWIVEGSGILAKETLGLPAASDAPYLAVAQKYTLPIQVKLKIPTTADDAVKQTLEGLKRLDSWAGKIDWTYVGDRAETKKMFGRFGDLVGGFKGWLVKHFWCTKPVRDGLGNAVAAANKTDFCKTDLFLSDNAAASPANPNVKPSTASVVFSLRVPEAEREKALAQMRDAAGEELTVTPLDDVHNGRPSLPVRVMLPQEHYVGGHHGSTPDRTHDAVDVLARGITRMEKKLGSKLDIVDAFTSKSEHAPSSGSRSVTSTVTLDLRVQIDDDRQKVLADVASAMGPAFEVQPLFGQEELDAHVRRLRSDSPLFQAGEHYVKQAFGADMVLFGNTTASNDCRYLADINPKSETLTFVPLLYTEHGAHAPDECATTDSLKRGVDWCVGVMEHLGQRKNLA